MRTRSSGQTWEAECSKTILNPSTRRRVRRRRRTSRARWIGDGRPSSGSVRTARHRSSRASRRSPRTCRPPSAYARRVRESVARLAPATRAADPRPARPRLAAGRRADIARLIALELGKPVKDGRGEIDRVADTFAVCAAEARQHRR